MSLPTQKTPPRDSMSDLTVLLYGASKIGKSTLCANTDHALFLATEAGLNSLDVFQQPILNWQGLCVAVADIEKGDHPFKTIILDTVDNAYKMCADHICRKSNIQHESDLGFGKGFSLVNNEFQRVMTKLSLLPYGFYLISHAQDKEMDTPTGKRIKTIPTLPGKAREIVLGMVDIILFCDVEMVPGPEGKKIERRVMRTKPSALYEAGDRTKRLPETIDLDFTAFVDAYKSGTTEPSPISAQPPAPVKTAPAAAKPAAKATPARPTQAPVAPVQASPATAPSEPPAEWVAAMVELAAVTIDMPAKTRQALIADFEAEGPAKLPELLAEIKAMRSILQPEPKSVGEAILQQPRPEATQISQEIHDFVDGPDGVDPLPADTDEANGGISQIQYEALNQMIGAFKVNRDALRSWAFKSGHLLAGANGPTLARLKADEFDKLRTKLCNQAIAAKGESWSQRTVRIINATPITTYQPMTAAS
jgi:hypothetical protein